MGPELAVRSLNKFGTFVMSDALAGRRILIVEDESLVSMLLETILEDLGCETVGPAGTVTDGLGIARQGQMDAALLDVNVAGELVFPIAQTLKDRGVPFVFSTGYGEGGLPENWRGNTTIQKPFTEAAVRDALIKALSV